jgi:hypothetical protein
MQLEGLGKLKKNRISSSFESRTFLLVALCLDHTLVRASLHHQKLWNVFFEVFQSASCR